MCERIGVNNDRGEMRIRVKLWWSKIKSLPWPIEQNSDFVSIGHRLHKVNSQFLQQWLEYVLVAQLQNLVEKVLKNIIKG